MNIQDQLKAYIVKEFMFDQNADAVTSDYDLLNNGVVDSMGILDIVSFMEEKFGVKVGDDEITPDNFRSLDALTKLVETKTGASEAA